MDLFEHGRLDASRLIALRSSSNSYQNDVGVSLHAAERLYLSLHAKQKASAKCAGALDVSWPYWKFKLGDYARGTPNAPIAHIGYRSLFIQARGVLKKALLAHLRATRAIRRSRHASLKRDGLGQITDAISIRERPATVHAIRST